MTRAILFSALSWYPILLACLAVRDLAAARYRFVAFRQAVPRLTGILLTAGAFIWVLGVWAAATETGIVSYQFLPTPTSVAGAFAGLFSTSSILVDITASFRRILIGFVPAAILGTLLGTVAGNFRRLYAVIIPLNSFMRYIPPTAFIALLIVWFGLGEALKASVIAVGVFFFLVQMTMEAVRNVPYEYIEVAYTLGTNPWGVFWRVTVPAALPAILAAWRINLSGAWTFLVIAEFLGATDGLGRLINISSRYNRIPDLFAAILLIGLIGLLSDALVERLLRSAFSWNRHDAGP